MKVVQSFVAALIDLENGLEQALPRRFLDDTESRAALSVHHQMLRVMEEAKQLIEKTMALQSNSLKWNHLRVLEQEMDHLRVEIQTYQDERHDTRRLVHQLETECKRLQEDKRLNTEDRMQWTRKESEKEKETEKLRTERDTWRKRYDDEVRITQTLQKKLEQHPTHVFVPVPRLLAPSVPRETLQTLPSESLPLPVIEPISCIRPTPLEKHVHHMSLLQELQQVEMQPVPVSIPVSIAAASETIEYVDRFDTNKKWVEHTMKEVGLRSLRIKGFKLAIDWLGTTVTNNKKDMEKGLKPIREWCRKQVSDFLHNELEQYFI